MRPFEGVSTGSTETTCAGKVRSARAWTATCAGSPACKRTASASPTFALNSRFLTWVIVTKPPGGGDPAETPGTPMVPPGGLAPAVGEAPPAPAELPAPVPPPAPGAPPLEPDAL